MSFDHENPRYRMCGVHVHMLTLIIAILGILLNIGASIGNYKTHTYGYYSTGIVSGICYLLLILGNRLESRVLYWPFFVINTLVLIFLVIVAVLLFILAADLSRGQYFNTWTTQAERDDAKTAAIVIGAIYIVSFIIQIAFMVIISRDYTYIRDMHYYPPGRVVAAPAPVVYAQQAPPPQVIHVVTADHCHSHAPSHCSD